MADVFTHFNYLHTIPEIGMKEFKTSAYVADVLKQLGYEVETQIGGASLRSVTAVNRDLFSAFARTWMLLGRKTAAPPTFAGMMDTWPCFLRRRRKS